MNAWYGIFYGWIELFVLFSRKRKTSLSLKIGTEHEWRHPLLDMPTILLSRNAEQLNNIPITCLYFFQTSESLEFINALSYIYRAKQAFSFGLCQSI